MMGDLAQDNEEPSPFAARFPDFPPAPLGSLAAQDGFDEPYRTLRPLRSAARARDFGSTQVAPLASGLGDIADKYWQMMKTSGSLLWNEPQNRVEPEVPGYWSDRDEARAAATAGALTLTGMATGLETMNPLARAVPNTLFAGGPRARITVRPREVMSDLAEANPRAQIGGNMPPEEFRMLPEEVPARPPPTAMSEIAATDVVPPPVPAGESARAPAAPTPYSYSEWNKALGRPRPATPGQVPDIRGLPVDEGIAIARTQPHLIVAGEQSPGYYVGGPADITSKADLNRQRQWFDNYVAQDPRGWDWYLRQRGGIGEATGSAAGTMDVRAGRPMVSRGFTRERAPVRIKRE